MERKHNRLVYSSQALCQVAEQIDRLYWETAQCRKGAVLGLGLPCCAPASGFPLLPPFPVRRTMRMAM